MSDIIRTDAYKISMAAAGNPLATETFHLSFRMRGPWFVPFDPAARVEAIIDSLLRPQPDGADIAFAKRTGYELSAEMLEAAGGEVEIAAVPAGSWIFHREPILTITGPSFLASWLEPLVIRFHHEIQFATELLRGGVTPAMGRHIGDDHRLLLEEIADRIDRVAPPLVAETEEYSARVTEVATELIEITGDPARIFEVGMRAAVTEEQHEVALKALAAAGVTSTSNVSLARRLGLRPVGTMGHEHVQRHENDGEAFRAMRDRFGGTPSYLLDTFDTIHSGIPTAIEVMLEKPHDAAIRYDSGDKVAQYLFAHEAFEKVGLAPVHILEDGFDAEMTREFEDLRQRTGIPRERQIYGYGGYLVARTSTNPLTRDRVAAVYKLSETEGRPCMKFGNETGIGKRSIPGRPVIWRRLKGNGPVGIIAQKDEPVPNDYVLLNGNPEALDRIAAAYGDHAPEGEHSVDISPATAVLEDRIVSAMNIDRTGRGEI